MSEDGHGDGKRLRRWYRRRWVKVLAALLLILGAAAAAGYWRLTAAEAELARLIEDIRRRGEPIDWADLKPAPIPEEDNAATYLRQAAELHDRMFELELDQDLDANGPALRREEDGRAILSERMFNRWQGSEHAEEAREYVRLAEPCLRLLRRARRCRGANWGVELDRPMGLTEIPLAGAHNRLCDLLRLTATAAWEDGRPLDAIEVLRDLMAMSRAVSQAPTAVTFVMRIGGEGMVSDMVERIGAGLTFAQPGTTGRQEMRGLIKDLLRDDGFVRAALGDRSNVYHVAEQLRSGRIRPSSLGAPSLSDLWGAKNRRRVFRQAIWIPEWNPATFAWEEIRWIRYMNGYVEAAGMPSHQAAAAVFAATEAEYADPDGFQVGTSTDGPENVCCWRFQYQAHRQMAAVALAMRLWQLDHGGRRPERLEELVPDYLASVPVDPFGADGAKIRYVDRWLLYSVFVDGVDNGGEVFIDEWGDVNVKKSPDLVFYLDGDRPTQGNKADEPGGP